MREFKVIVDGEEKKANMVTRIYAEELGLEYVYYYIIEDDDSDGTQKSLMTSRIKTDEEGFDEIIPIESEEERKLAFKIFQDTYKDADKLSD